jgi:transposase-like protein
MEAALTDQSLLVPNARRRHWSLSDKRRIVEETEIAGVSSIARAHKVNSSQIFSWRKSLFGSRRIDCTGVHTQMQSGEIRDSLSRINMLLKIVGSASQQLLSESESKRQPIYNLSSAVNNLASATCKLEEQRLVLSDKLARATLEEQQLEVKPEIDYPAEVEREAEKLLLHLVRTRLIPKQQQEDIEGLAKAY